MRGIEAGWNTTCRAAVTFVSLLLASCGHSISVGPGRSAVTAGPEFAYVSNSGDGKISVFSIDKKTGVLSLVQSVPAGGSGLKGLAAAPSASAATHLYAANQTASRIFCFDINQSSGKLTPTSQVSVSTGSGTGPLTMTVPPIGTRLYVVDSLRDQIFGYSVDKSTGVLAAMPNSPTPVPSPFSGGTLDSLAAAPGSESLYVSDSHYGEIYGYSIASDGSLAFIGNIPSLGTAIGVPLWLSNDPAGGDNLFDADAAGGPGGSVSVFSIGVGGALTQVGVFGTGNTINNPVALAVSPSLPFLYTVNDLNANVTQLTISSGGELNDAVLLPNYTNASSIALDNHGSFAYIVDSPDALVFQNSIDQSSGSLVVLDPSSLPTENPANPSAAPFQVIAVETPGAS